MIINARLEDRYYHLLLFLHLLIIFLCNQLFNKLSENSKAQGEVNSYYQLLLSYKTKKYRICGIFALK